MKKFVIFIVIFSLVIFSLCAYLIYRTAKDPVSALSYNIDETKLTVIIDPGHGGPDGGAVASDGTAEKDLNLSIALKLSSLLTQRGVQNILTRNEDISVNDESAKTLREIKVSDLHNRLKIMNSISNCIYVSIHQNSYRQSKYSGAQVFYSPNDESSPVLAQCIQQAVKDKLQPDNTRLIKECTESVYIIYNADKPAVLVECGFMTNAQELANLKNEEYQHKMASAVADGILDYINKGS